MRKAIQWVWDNSLSLVFFALFVAALVGQSVSGFYGYTDQLRAHGRPAISYAEYLCTGDFLDAVFANWQAAILQLACLIVLTVVFRQRGASQSRRPESRTSREERRRLKRFPWFYRNSLSIAFGLLFLVSLLGHVIFGTWSYNEISAMRGEAPVTIGFYLFLVLTIFLRQEGSAESKPVGSRDTTTGEVNK